MLFRFVFLGTCIGCATHEIQEPPTVASSEDIEASWADEEENCPKSWLLTYAISGVMDVTDTPLDMGNAREHVGGGNEDLLVLRVADNNGVPSDGKVLLTYFNLQQDISVTIDMLGEYTIASSLLSHADNECGASIGALSDTTIHWGECHYGSGHGDPSWTPESGAEGVGCIHGYHVQGTIDCVDNTPLGTCSDGWLNEGSNPQNYVYAQPLLSIEFADTDMEHFVMQSGLYGVEIPTYSNNRTWLALEGRLIESRLEHTPACLCQ